MTLSAVEVPRSVMIRRAMGSQPACHHKCHHQPNTGRDLAMALDLTIPADHASELIFSQWLPDALLEIECLSNEYTVTDIAIESKTMTNNLTLLYV